MQEGEQQTSCLSSSLLFISKPVFVDKTVCVLYFRSVKALSEEIAQSVQWPTYRQNKHGFEFRFSTSSTPTLRLPCVSGGDSTRLQRPGHEGDHWLPSSTEVKGAWSYTSTRPTSSWRGT
jgi:hypothetical protein